MNSITAFEENTTLHSQCEAQTNCHDKETAHSTGNDASPGFSNQNIVRETGIIPT